ncbi:organic solvent tolerance protein [Candidatus Pelagibacter sp.]|nr:organic solvent tolerance protein [Candidatus Pelagibacter sp.]
MKNNCTRIVIIFFTYLFINSHSLGDEFNFKISELDITENGNIYTGINGGSVTTNDDLEVISDNFKYNKSKQILTAYGNVVVIDNKNKVKILAKKITYLKNIEKIFTEGKTKVIIDNEYFADTSDLVFLRNSMILSSNKNTIIKDTLNNIYSLNEFDYLVNEEILKGDKIKTLNIFNDGKDEKYSINSGFFDLKNKKFLGKDIKVDFDNEMFGETENNPRLRSVSGTGNKFFTYLKKATFTTCKQDDNCPPWLIESENATHDKEKKQIIYKNAWLKIYDVPVIYFPKFFHPDPSVKRQSGFLRPKLEGSDLLGRGIYTPYFYAITDDKDLTFKPKLYDDGKIIFQSEYRQKTKKTVTIADFSYTKGYQSTRADDHKDSRTHFFTKTFIDLDLDSFINSKLELQFQKTSNKSYLKIFQLDSPLLTEDNSVLESFVKLDIEDEDFDFTVNFERYETLGSLNNDRYQYILPSYNFSKIFNYDQYKGSFNFNSYGNNTLKETNILTSDITNDLNYIFATTYSNFGLKKESGIYLKNLNSIGKNNLKYKSSPQSELTSAVMYSASLPLTKKNLLSKNTLEPKLSFRYSPNQMKNHSNDTNLINVSNIYSINRLGISDSYEEGASLTIGANYKKEKINEIRKYDKNNKEIEDFFEFKIATVLRNKGEKNISTASTINKKNSNTFGQINYSLSEYVALNYDFSIDNNFKTFEYNSIDTTLSYKNFSTQISYLEQNGAMGDVAIIENTSKYEFDQNNSISFATRRDKKLNLTEYYDLIYEYKNDCLTAGIEYKKKYYNDVDLKPSEELFFSITIVPLGTFSPNAIKRSGLDNLLNK